MVGMQTRVALAGVPRGVADEELKQAVRNAAELATDFSWLSSGDSVLIKLSQNSGLPYPANTNPLAAAAMVELLKQKGAGQVVVSDMSGMRHVGLSPQGTTGSTRSLMEASGMAHAVLAVGAELCGFEDAGWEAFHEELPPAGSHWRRGVMMPDIVREVQHIVLMPRCGRHRVAGATLGMKAAVGYWRTDTRLEFHRDAATLHEKTAEANAVPSLLKKQRLVLTAADKVLATFGPDAGQAVEPQTGLVFASESVVAHDMVSLSWLLESRRALQLSRWDSYRDRAALPAWWINRKAVARLSDWRTALFCQGVTKNDLQTIGDDRILNRAYGLLGGRPQVVLAEANGLVPDHVRGMLERELSPSD